MTDPGQQNDINATTADEANVDATVGPDDDATVFPDDEPADAAPTVVTDDAADVDDEATVYPDDEPADAAPTMVTDDAADADDEATVYPDDEPVDAAPTMVTDDAADVDDEATVYPDDEAVDAAPTMVTDDAADADDEATVYPDDEPSAPTVVTPAVEDDATIMGDEPADGRTMTDGGPPATQVGDATVVGDEPAATVGPRSAATQLGGPTVVDGTVNKTSPGTTTDETQSGRSRLKFGKRRDSKTKAEKSASSGPTDRPQIPEKERYDLVDNFAHGGMGSIWKAHDKRIHRDVAYKELLPRAVKRPRVVDRFIQEAQITGQLEHPGIVPIYDLGWQENGAPFYAMKLVHGVEMKDRIEEMHKLAKDSTEYRRTFVKLLGSFIDTCNALAFAHARGVLHRDLKPQNVMLGAFGETLVLDWGIAKILDETGEQTDGAVMISGEYNDQFDADEEMAGSTLGTLVDETNAGATAAGTLDSYLPGTQMGGTVKTDSRTEGTATKYGSVMGTPAYMPPEQAEGKLDQMDGRTDVYSLGAILYEILTDDAPVPRGKMDEMLDHVKNKPIRPPIELEPTTPRPLNAIALKALSKRREDRYGSALLLAQDIEDYLADEPVTAYAEPWYDKARRWAKRHRTAVTATAAVVIALILGMVAWGQIEANRLSTLQAAAEAKLNEARGLTVEGRFEDAKLKLTEATGFVENEESLQAVATALAGQMSAIDRLAEAAERERLATVRLEVEQELAQAADIVEAGERLNDAQVTLTEVVTRLSDEPELTELRDRAQADLTAVSTLIATQQQRDEAQQTFAEFAGLVDQARFYATVTTGDDRLQNATTALEAAKQAFELYGGLSDDYLASTPEHLSETQAEELRRASYELILVSAESTLTASLYGDEQPQKEAAENALAMLKQAELLGIESRALLLRRARYLDVSGDENERDLTLLAAQDVKPSSALDFFLIGEEQRRASKYEEALQSYRQALQSDPENFWSLHQMAQTHLLSGQAEAAVAGYTACIARRPDERICYLTRGIAYASLSQIEPALADLNYAQKLDPNLYAVYLNRGAVHVAAQEFDSAIADFEKAAELRPAYAGPHVNLGEVYRIQKQFDESEAALTKAIEFDNSNIKAHRIRAMTRLQLMRPEDARMDWQQVIELDDDPLAQADAWQQIGKTWHRGGEPEQALEAYDRSIAANPQNSDNYRLKAEVLLALNRDDEAIEAFTKFLEFGKPVGDVYRARALALAKLGRSTEAMSDFTRALELEPSANMLTRRGWAFLLEANQLAAADFDAAISENPDNADAWNGRGYARVMMGNLQGSISDAEQAVIRATKQAQVQGPAAWPHLYNAATIYAQAVGKMLTDARIPEAARESNASKLTARAIQVIGLAIQAAGPSQRAAVVQTLQTDTALDPIRQRPEFLKAFAPKPSTDNN